MIQPDAKSWFQVGSAYANLGQAQESIDAYERAIALDPDYDLAMFDLGGAHWNSGDWEQALLVWRRALERFPSHELTARLRKELPIPL